MIYPLHAPSRDLLLALALFGTLACGGDGGSGPEDASEEELEELVDELRNELADADVEPLASAPEVEPELVALGQALFFDKILSGNQDVSCATCHLPSRAGADGRSLPRGVDGSGTGPDRVGGAIVPRHSPTILNAHLIERAFWDGRVQIGPGGELQVPAEDPLPAEIRATLDPRFEVLAAQALFPPTSRDEMRGQLGDNPVADLADDDLEGIWAALTERVLSFPEYGELFADAYPGTLLAEFHFGHIANAIAAFEVVAFEHLDSPWNRFLEGDDGALDADALRGGIAFFSGAGCGRCHDGGALDGGFHNIGLPQFGPGKGDGLSGLDDFGRERVVEDEDTRYEFRTPALLNIELTGPYGHLGQIATLEGIVRHYRDASSSLGEWSIVDELDDVELHGTQLANELAVLERLDQRLEDPRNFDVDLVVEFLRALTADSARDLGDLVPERVPSGLPLDV